MFMTIKRLMVPISEWKSTFPSLNWKVEDFDLYFTLYNMLGAEESCGAHLFLIPATGIFDWLIWLNFACLLGTLFIFYNSKVHR